MKDKAKRHKTKQAEKIDWSTQTTSYVSLSRETQCRTSQCKRKCKESELTKREYSHREVNSATAQNEFPCPGNPQLTIMCVAPL